MDAIPETTFYMIGGFAVFTIVMVIYLWSLYSRWKSLEEEQQALNELKSK